MSGRFSKYPIDFASLKVGDVITTEEIEQYFSVKRGTKEFAFKVMHLQSAINTQTNFTAKQSDEDLHILTWEEASKYNDKSIDSSLRKVKRHIGKQIQVRTDEFSPELKTKHERRVMKGGFLLEALKGARKKIIQAEPKKIKA